MPLDRIATIGDRFTLKRMQDSIPFPSFGSDFIVFSLPWLLYFDRNSSNDPITDSFGMSHTLTASHDQSSYGQVDVDWAVVDTVGEVLGMGDPALFFNSDRVEPLFGSGGYEAFYSADALTGTPADEDSFQIGEPHARVRMQETANLNKPFYVWFPDPGCVIEFTPGSDVQDNTFDLAHWSSRRLAPERVSPPASHISQSTTIPRISSDWGIYGSSDASTRNFGVQILRLYFPRLSRDPEGLEVEDIWYSEDEFTAGVGRIDIQDSTFQAISQRNRTVIINRRDSLPLGASFLLDGIIYDVVNIEEEAIPRRRFQKITLINRDEQ